MDPNVQQSNVPPQPTVLHTEASHKSPLLITLAVGLLMLVIGLAGGYLIANSNKRSVTQKINQITQVSPTVTVSSPTISTKEVMIEPINAALFERRVSDNTYCNTVPGITRYLEKQGNASMAINNTTLKGTTESKKSLAEVIAYLTSNIPLSPNTKIDSYDSAFKDYCSGSYSYVFEDKGVMVYPKTDLAKALLIIGGNGGYAMEARIYAQKGDNLIILTKLISDSPLYKSLTGDCQGQPKTISEAHVCYQKALTANPALLQETNNEVQQLISTFSLK